MCIRDRYKEGAAFLWLSSVPNIALSDTAHDYGSVSVGQSATWEMEIYNVGKADLIIDSVSGDDNVFEILTTLPETIPAGCSGKLEIRFTPTETGDYNITLLVYSNDPNNGITHVYLSGKGIAPDIWVSDTSHNFGEELSPGDTILWTFYIKNTGEYDLRVDSITSSNPIFGVLAPFAKLSISPGDSISVVTYCSPQDTGSYQGILTIYSNDPDEPEVEIKLSATATAISEKLPEKFELHLFPNIFPHHTKICYSVPREMYLKIKIIDITGRVVSTIVENNVKPGHYTVQWVAKDRTGRLLPSGIYFIVMDGEAIHYMCKAILLH